MAVERQALLHAGGAYALLVPEPQAVKVITPGKGEVFALEYDGELSMQQVEQIQKCWKETLGPDAPRVVILCDGFRLVAIKEAETQPYFNQEDWKRLGDPALEIDEFIGCPAVCALDIATQVFGFLVRGTGFKKVLNGEEHYYIFMTLYLPEAQADQERYREWVREGCIQMIPSGPFDLFEQIENETLAECRSVNASELAFDPWNAAGIAASIQKKTNGRTMAVAVPHSSACLSFSMKNLTELIASGRIHHEGNPAMGWMLENVCWQEDGNGNVFPIRDLNQRGNRSDGAVALIMLLSRLSQIKETES